MKELNWTKLGFIGDGIFFLVLALGFAFQIPWVTWIWNWSDDPMTGIFLTALLASYSAGSLLLAWLEEWPAAIGGAIALVIGFGGFAITAAVMALNGGDTDLIIHAAVMAVIAAIAVATAFTGLSSRSDAPRALPRGLRYTYLALAPLMVLIGLQLVFHIPAILPWPLTWQTSMLLGWILIGFSANYGYVALRGDWAAGQVLLFGFLVYDIVFVVPLLQHGADVVGVDFWISQVINVCVVVFSAALAIYYLFLNRETSLMRDR